MKPSWWRKLRCRLRRDARKNGVKTLCADCVGCIVMYFAASGVIQDACRDEEGDLSIGDFIAKHGRFIVKLHKEFGI